MDKRGAAIQADAEKQARAALAIADRHLAQHDWFAGEDFSFGDIVMGCLYWRYAGLGRAGDDTPHLAEWFEAVKQRAPFRQHVALPVARTSEEWTRIERELA